LRRDDHLAARRQLQEKKAERQQSPDTDAESQARLLIEAIQAMQASGPEGLDQPQPSTPRPINSHPMDRPSDLDRS
jgi:hypothetical protein